MGIPATFMLAPGCSPWRPQSEPTTSRDAVTDGGGGADMRRASNRLRGERGIVIALASAHTRVNRVFFKLYAVPASGLWADADFLGSPSTGQIRQASYTGTCSYAAIRAESLPGESRGHCGQH